MPSEKYIAKENVQLPEFKFERINSDTGSQCQTYFRCTYVFIRIDIIFVSSLDIVGFQGSAPTLFFQSQCYFHHVILRKACSPHPETHMWHDSKNTCL